MSASPECHDQPTPEDEAAGWRSLAGYLGDQIAELRAGQTRPKLVQFGPAIGQYEFTALDSDGQIWGVRYVYEFPNPTTESDPMPGRYVHRWERIPGPPDLRP